MLLIRKEIVEAWASKTPRLCYALMIPAPFQEYIPLTAKITNVLSTFVEIDYGYH
jgi:hypothetical protein